MQEEEEEEEQLVSLQDLSALPLVDYRRPKARHFQPVTVGSGDPQAKLSSSGVGLSLEWVIH